jgi:hypothetical protein
MAAVAGRHPQQLLGTSDVPKPRPMQEALTP